MTSEVGSAEGEVNPELVKNIAKDLQEKFLSLNTDGEDAVSTDEAWIEVAKVAIAKLQPLAVNSELPNDAQHGSGVKTLNEASTEAVGGLVDPSVPPETKSGE